MLPNPYTPGRVPRRFVGREAELLRVRREMAPVVAFGEMLGGPLLLSGPRGVGKTSLLLEVRRWAESQGFVVAHTSGVKHQPFLGDVLDRVSVAVQGIGPTSPRRRRVDELGASVGMSLASASVKMTWEDADAGRAHPATSPALVSPVEDLLHQCAVLVREGGGAGLLLLIDELHEPLGSVEHDRYLPNPVAVRDAAVLLNALQNLDNDRSENPLGLIAAGLPETGSHLMRAATFAERTNEIRISELDPTTARAVLTVPAHELGVRWEDTALDVAVGIADGYPQALQVAGKWTWDAAEPDDGDTLCLADIQAAGPEIARHLDTMYERRWATATPTEREFLTAIASLEVDDPDRRVRRAHIAAQLGRTTSSIGPVRESALSKGIVEDAGHGYLRFTLPGFGPWLRANDEDATPGPVLGPSDNAAQTRLQASRREQRQQLPRGPSPGGSPQR